MAARPVLSVAIAFHCEWRAELTRAHGTATAAAWSTLAGFVARVPLADWEL